MKIGKYTLHTIETGCFYLDGGAMFGIIPKTIWNLKITSDESNRIPLAVRSVLLVSDKRKILIDTGIGDKWGEKYKNIYQIQQDKQSLFRSLNNLNIKREEITDILLTHLHFDHAGGCTQYFNEKLVPSFPNATFYTQKKHYEWALDPSNADSGSFIKNDFLPLMENGLLKFIEGDTDFDDEIRVMTFNGHTFGQQLFKIHDSSTTLFYSGDLFPTTHHIPLHYIMAYDLQPLVTIEDKKRILENAVKKEWILFFQHDPVHAMARVMKKDGRFLASLIANG